MAAEMEHDRRLAMLIDGENAQPKLLGSMLREASKYGVVTIRRIYGDWASPGMAGWRDRANKYAFDTRHQLKHATRKNSIDIFLIIEAMDILHSGTVDGFCIVSSDSDFTGLAKRVREAGLFVMGIGRTSTPQTLQHACEVFTFVDILSGPPKKTPGPKAKLPKWRKVVLKAIDAVDATESGTDRWVHLGVVGHNIRKISPSFDVRMYRSKNLVQLLMTAEDYFEVREEKTESGHSVYYVRALRK